MKSSMKRFSLAMVVVLAGTGMASAELSFSGSAYLGVGSTDGGKTWSAISRTTLNLSFSAQTDSGLGFGLDLGGVNLGAAADSARASATTAAPDPYRAIEARGMWWAGDFTTFSRN